MCVGETAPDPLPSPKSQVWKPALRLVFWKVTSRSMQPEAGCGVNAATGVVPTTTGCTKVAVHPSGTVVTVRLTL